MSGLVQIMANIRLPTADAYAASLNLPYTTHYFPQILDHFTFTPNSSKLFPQRYLINSTFWSSSSSPIFVYAGAEDDITWLAYNSGFLFDIAPIFNALLVFIEHRFYGESLPFGEDSYTSIDNLGYFTSTQALADYAVLIRSLKHNLSAEAAPVVVFGASYGGMLAAWFRLKYPHIAMGALASSAPILQFDKIVPWTGFYDAVSQSYKDESMNCFEVIKGCWDKLMELQSASLVEGWLNTAFVSTAMYDYPVPVAFLPTYPVKQMCRIIDGFPNGTSTLDKVFAAASVYYNSSGTEQCFDFASASLPLNGWSWQACTEMVMPMSRSNESMFLPYAYDYKQREAYCKSIFGVQPRPHWITTEYGGYRIEHVLERFGSNIIFSNGMRDPWRQGGLIKIFINIFSFFLGAHVLDLFATTKNDPKWLIEQRENEIEIIKGWINQYFA
ncbi:Peptidase S28 protein [Dioscorea alata]|uniref:Peptidase S28 protein n=1 Tax=Dioscorea alata TaxID=55571 RepID=A0ACB7VD86_DIOAL|nr:Peptidase S28 protein [Dioscorea alata]